MDSVNLSANWKKLQQSSKPQNKPGHEAKSVSGFKRRAHGEIAKHQAKKLKAMDSIFQKEQTRALSTAVIGKYIAIDCEMVGTLDLTPLSVPAHNKDTPSNAPKEYSILARVSLVNYHGDTVYDSYVLPPPGVNISDYRTPWSGITAAHLVGAKPFAQAQEEVDNLLKGRILVGHAIKNDLAVMGLGHPLRDIRDTSRYPKYRELAATMGKNGKIGKARTPSLKRLAKEVLGLDIQTGRAGHDSAEDARTTMMLFQREKDGFEIENAKTFGRNVRSNILPTKRDTEKTLRDQRGHATINQEKAIDGRPDEMSKLDKQISGASSRDSVFGSDDSETDITATANDRISKKKKKKKKNKSRTKR